MASVSSAAPERAAPAVRVTDDVDRRARSERQRLGDGGDVLELALDRVRRRVARRAAAAPVDGVDGERGRRASGRRRGTSVWSAVAPWTRISGGPSPVLNTAIGVPSRDSTTRDGAPAAHGRSPGVADVRLALLVPGAVAGRDRDEPVPLVERPCPGVDREAVQVEARRTALLGEVDQPATDAAADPVGRDVQLVHHRLGQRHQRDDAAGAVGRDPRLVARQHLVGEPAPDVVVGMGRREVERRAPRGEPDVAEGRAVVGAGAPDRHLGGARGVARLGRHRSPSARQPRGGGLVEDPGRPGAHGQPGGQLTRVAARPRRCRR